MRFPSASPLTFALALVAGLAVGSNPRIQALTWWSEWRYGSPADERKTEGVEKPAPACADGGRTPAATVELTRLREAEARLFPSSSSGASSVLQTSPVVATVRIPTGGFGDLDEPDIPVPEQPEIETYLRFFTENGEGRALLERWLERRARYRPFVSPAPEQENMPHAVEAIILAESGYHPRARSPVGAMGLWQLMPETARLYGLTVEHEYDERRDPS